MAGGTPLGQMYIELGLDVSKFNPSLTSAKNAVKYFQNNVKALDSTLKSHGNNADLLKSKYKSLGQAIEAQKNVLDQMKKGFDKLDPGSAKYDKAAADIERENAKLSAMEGQLYKVEQALKAVARENSFSGRMEALGQSIKKGGENIQNFGKKISDLGGTLTKGLTAPLVASAGFALKAAIDYESAFAGVKKTVDGTPQQFDKLSASIRNMAKEMPSSAVEIAHVAEAAGQLGVPVGAIKEFSKTMVNLGVSTNLSAEEAASSIAKIGNIMKVSKNDLGEWSSHFGSAVVDLGNHFATTERDIVEMTNRLAAGGKLAGLTTPEILGLATAMSSVGIEAEAGGTAMTQTLTSIGKAVSGVGKGATEKLELIAQTAGMTSEQFTKAWKEKPAQALQSFIKGLQKATDEGKNMDGILDELGMTGIRQGNMLKSLASASDTMTDAVNRSNSAWKKNSALTEEARKRYETTESQLKIFKNKITDIAIEFGGPLLKALNSGLDAAKPWLKTLSEMAEKFSKMSSEQQQNIIKWSLMGAAAGPALKLLGGGLGIIGGLTKGFGSLVSGIGKVSGAIKTFKDAGSVAGGFKALSASIGQVGTATAEASTSTSLLSTAVASLGNPVTWGVLAGGVALVGLTYIAEQMAEAENRTQRWGTSVSKVQDEQLSGFKSKVDEANKAIVDFGATAGNVDNVKASFEKLNSEIDKLIDEKKEKLQALAKEVGMSEEVRKHQEEQLEQTKVNVRNMTEEVGRIYQNAKDQHRDLTIEEKAIVSNIQHEMISQELDLLNVSKDKKHAIMQAMNGDVKSMNETQRRDALKVVTDWVKEEEKVYEKRKQAIKKAYKNDDSVKGIQERNQKLDELEAEHLARKEAYQQKYMELEKSFLDNYNGRWSKEALQGVKSRMGALGLDVKQFEEYMRSAADTVTTSSGIVAKSMANMSKETAEANTVWNSLVLDDKKGEIKTNAKEEISKVLEAENGWNSIEFILKNAILETNAKMLIGETLVETGKWNELTLEQKELVLDGHKGMQAILENKEALAQWNALPAEAKELLMKNEAFLNSGNLAISTLQKWNQLSPEQKEIIAKDLATGEVTKIQQALNTLVGMNPNIPIDATDNSSKVISQVMNDILNIPKETNTNINADASGAEAGKNQAIEAYGAVNNYQVPMKPITADASNAVNAGQSAINKQNEWNATPSPTKLQTGDAGSAVNAGQSAINKQNEWNALYSPMKYMTGDATSAMNAANSASGSIRSVPTSWHTTITATEVVNRVVNTVGRLFGHKDGTDYHPGGLAMVNDQRNAVYREMVTLPDGRSFIPEGRDVIMPLPRGSKVLRADKTRRLMQKLGIPKYASGVGIPEDAKFLKEMEKANREIVLVDNKGGNEYDGQNVVAEIAFLRSSLEKLLTAILEKPSETYLDGNVLAQNSYQRYSKIMAREGI